MFIFLSTPTAILQLLKQNSFTKEVFNLKWADNLPLFLSFLIKDYFLTGITQLVNVIFQAVAGIIAEQKKFPTKYQYHKYLLNISYWYLCLNMVIMPGLTLSGGNSIYNLVSSDEYDFKNVIDSIKLIDGGSFFINLILQAVGLNFLVDCQRVSNCRRLSILELIKN